MSSPRNPVRTVALSAVSALALGGAMTAPMSSAQAAVSCATGYDSGEFGGTKVSRQYSTSFNAGARMHWLDRPYTPQGIGAWPNWRGGTEDLLVVGMHHRDENSNRSLIYGMTPGGTHRGTASLPVGAHTGGVKVFGKWLYVQQNTSTLRRYRLSTVRDSFASPGVQYLGAGTEVPVYDVSTFDIDDGYLYGAKNNTGGRDKMRRWKINKDTGSLARDYSWGPLQVPKNTQGIHVLSNTYIFSTSGGRDERGNIYVVRRGYTRYQQFTDVRYRCFRSVAMVQELTGLNGRTYLTNESGAQEFSGPDGSGDYRIHNIKHLHVAGTESLRSLVW
jgi:hypothetical protein